MVECIGITVKSRKSDGGPCIELSEIGTIIRFKFSFEAMEVYKKTLDLTQAIKKGQELADIQKRKGRSALPDRKLRKREEKAEEAAAGKSQRIGRCCGYS